MRVQAGGGKKVIQFRSCECGVNPTLTQPLPEGEGTLKRAFEIQEDAWLSEKQEKKP
jgi:hypothetical protein